MLRCIIPSGHWRSTQYRGPGRRVLHLLYVSCNCWSSSEHQFQDGQVLQGTCSNHFPNLIIDGFSFQNHSFLDADLKKIWTFVLLRWSFLFPSIIACCASLAFLLTQPFFVHSSSKWRRAPQGTSGHVRRAPEGGWRRPASTGCLPHGVGYHRRVAGRADHGAGEEMERRNWLRVLRERLGQWTTSDGWCGLVAACGDSKAGSWILFWDQPNPCRKCCWTCPLRHTANQD